MQTFTDEVYISRLVQYVGPWDDKRAVLVWSVSEHPTEGSVKYVKSHIRESLETTIET